jgi:hypothetical protein
MEAGNSSLARNLSFNHCGVFTLWYIPQPNTAPPTSYIHNDSDSSSDNGFYSNAKHIETTRWMATEVTYNPIFKIVLNSPIGGL